MKLKSEIFSYGCFKSQFSIHIQKWPHKFQAGACIATQRHLTDLYGTYLCRMIQNESKECMRQALYIEQCTKYGLYCQRLAVDPCQPTVLSSNGNGKTQVNDTCTTTIFSGRRLFSALFNTKTNIVQRIAWFLNTGKKTVCTRSSIV